MGYRKIWIKHYGEIPKDEFGRTYEIHHIDGNRKNNELSNLLCLSIREHYNLHLLQGDFAAAFRIAQRMGVSIEEKSKLMSLSNKKRIESGLHPFVDSKVRQMAAETIKNQLRDGSHHFLSHNRDVDWKEKANKSYAEKHNRSEKVKESWSEYRKKNPNSVRTLKGSKAGADKTKGTKWYHKPDGSQLRTIESDVRLQDGWILGRFNPHLNNKNTEQ